MEPLSNVPLPVETEGSGSEDGNLSNQDFEFVAQHSGKLSFLEKIEKDEFDQLRGCAPAQVSLCDLGK